MGKYRIEVVGKDIFRIVDPEGTPIKESAFVGQRRILWFKSIEGAMRYAATLINLAKMRAL